MCKIDHKHTKTKKHDKENEDIGDKKALIKRRDRWQICKTEG